MKEVIGAGENTLIKILREIYPKSTIQAQVKLSKLLKKEYRDDMSSRQSRETLDIIMRRNNKLPIVFRVQDRHHNSKYMCKIDESQRFVLERSGYGVIDIWYHECETLFKELLNDDSREEIRCILRANHLL